MKEICYCMAALVTLAFFLPGTSEACRLGHRTAQPAACAPAACAPAQKIPALPASCALPNNAVVVPVCATCSQPAALVGKARCAARKVAGLALRLPRTALKALRGKRCS